MGNSTLVELKNVEVKSTPSVEISVDGKIVAASEGELLVEAILREKDIPHICYHSPLMGPIQTCDTCMVEVDGKLVRSCGTKITSQMKVVTESKKAKDARSEAFDVILGNHMLYCTVCDNNNEDCRVHNTAVALKIEHQETPFTPKPYEVDMSNPFYRYDPSQCILCGQCVQACQNVQVNETLSIGWELDRPRVLWDGYRLALMMVNMLGSIDADKISRALAAGSKEPPSLLAMGKQATSKEARRAMAVGLGLLNAFGEALEKSKPEKHG